MVKSAPLPARFPKLAGRLGKVSLSVLPTPVRETTFRRGKQLHTVWIKEDNLTSELYGGNKVRKLEYLLQRAINKRCGRVATFGAVGSHHALATALYAKQLNLECTTFLSHQARTASIAATLNTHLKIGTELVRYGGTYADRIRTLRKYLQGRNTWVVPAGGSSWLGTVGFIDAGLELAAQIDAMDLPAPDRIYVATGTMSTAAGLALGLALAEMPVEIHAVRVSNTSIANTAVLDRLMKKTTAMLKCLDSSFPGDLAARAHIVLRNDFFGDGYAQSNATIEAAIDFAADHLGLSLESTYTAKAMPALLNDLSFPGSGALNFLFWNTYHSKRLDAPSDLPLERDGVPPEFLRYFE